MHITMVKKRLLGGAPCEKCAQTEEMLRRRGLWEHVDDVLWAVEGEDDSPGFVLAREHGVEVAPFFVVEGAPEADAARVYTSAMRMLRELFPQAPASSARRATAEAESLQAAAARLAEAPPQEILSWALTRYGERCGIAFSGAEDIALIDMATRTELPFRVFTLDTGRLHDETYAFLDEARRRYGVEIQPYFPDSETLESLLHEKGPNSFFRDGHGECCSVRKLAPLRRALAPLDAWVTGQRRDQNPITRANLAVLAEDTAFRGRGEALVRVNPLASWSAAQLWDYIRSEGVPYNPLHDRGFASLTCQPCSRPVGPGQHERAGRWWWEEGGDKEWGLYEGGEGI